MKRICFILILCLLAAACDNKPPVKPEHIWFNDKGFIKSIQLSDFEGINGIVYTTNVNLGAFNEDGQNALIYAVENTNNAELITAIAESGRVDLNAKNRQGYTALELAARHNPEEGVILALLTAGAQIENPQKLADMAWDNPNPRIQTLLNRAVKKMPWDRNYAFVTAATNADVQALRRELPFTNMNLPGKYPMLLIFKKPNKDIINILLKTGQDINHIYTPGKMTLLHMAAKTIPDPDIINTLLKAGAFVDNQDDKGMTPLMYALAFNPNGGAVAEVLIKAKADVNAKSFQGETPLHFALKATENPHVIKMLLDAGADPNVKNKNGDTPLMLAAAFCSNEEIVSMLLKAKADINAVNNKGYTAFMAAVMQNKNEMITRALLNAGADINDKSPDGLTALQGAAANNPNERIPVILIREGAEQGDFKLLLKYAKKNKNPKVYDAIEPLMPFAETPAGAEQAVAAKPKNSTSKKAWYNNNSFETAVKRGDAEALAAAIKKENINVQVMFLGERSISALMFALAHTNKETVIETLIKAGAPVKVTNEKGDTALLVAALITKNPKIIDALVRAGADINKQDATGITPLMAAAANNDPPAVNQALLNSGADRSNISALLNAAEKNPNPAVKEMYRNLK